MRHLKSSIIPLSKIIKEETGYLENGTASKKTQIDELELKPNDQTICTALEAIGIDPFRENHGKVSCFDPIHNRIWQVPQFQNLSVIPSVAEQTGRQKSKLILAYLWDERDELLIRNLVTVTISPLEACSNFEDLENDFDLISKQVSLMTRRELTKSFQVLAAKIEVAITEGSNGELMLRLHVHALGQRTFFPARVNNANLRHALARHFKAKVPKTVHISDQFKSRAKLEEEVHYVTKRDSASLQIAEKWPERFAEWYKFATNGSFENRERSKKFFRIYGPLRGFETMLRDQGIQIDVQRRENYTAYRFIAMPPASSKTKPSSEYIDDGTSENDLSTKKSFDPKNQSLGGPSTPREINGTRVSTYMFLNLRDPHDAFYSNETLPYLPDRFIHSVRCNTLKCRLFSLHEEKTFKDRWNLIVDSGIYRWMRRIQ